MTDRAASPPEAPAYFAYSATLRIAGSIEQPESISGTLGLQPTHFHRRGERRGPHSPAYEHDLWSYRAPVPEERPLEEHIAALWAQLQPHRSYLLALKSHLTVDVFCGYRSNSDTAGIEVSHTCLELFTALEVPFGLSIIIA